MNGVFSLAPINFDIEGRQLDKVEQTPDSEILTSGRLHRHILFSLEDPLTLCL